MHEKDSSNYVLKIAELKMQNEEIREIRFNSMQLLPEQNKMILYDVDKVNSILEIKIDKIEYFAIYSSQIHFENFELQEFEDPESDEELFFDMGFQMWRKNAYVRDEDIDGA